MKDRVFIILALSPIFFGGLYLGGLWFTAMIGIIIGIAVWEFARLFKKQGFKPAVIWSITGALAILFTRHFFSFTYDKFLLPVLILGAMIIHLSNFEHEKDQNSASSLGITLTAIFYIAYMGSFFIALRNLENGLWWFLLSLPGGWLADSGAYEVGRRIGKHKMAPHLSPHKSWEGYFGGVLSSIIGICGLVFLYQKLGMPVDLITYPQAIILGVLLGFLPTLGDLGESMIKRQAKEKDSGTILRGHGGVFDRIDSWLWMGFIGYVFATVLNLIK